MLKVVTGVLAPACAMQVLIGAVLTGPVFTDPVLAEMVHSLDQVPKHLKTPQGKKFFSEQMQGKPAPDRLGVHLPAALPAKTVANLLVPPGDKAAPTVVGAKPWPGHADLYVAIVCTGGAGPLGTDPRCAQADPGGKQPPLHVYLGVVAVKGGETPRLVAASGAIDGATGWGAMGLPRAPMAADEAAGAVIRPDSFDRFDLAPNKIAANENALGLRTAWSESYSGGGANFTGLCLFVVEGNKLKQVLAVPMSAYADVAGDWHKDGTRDHDITDSANVLVVSTRQTDRHFDLVVKNRAAHWQQVYRWSDAAGAYQAAKK